MEWHRGTVIAFDPDVPAGLVRADGTMRRVLVMAAALAEAGFTRLRAGDHVAFTVERDGYALPRATQVRLIGSDGADGRGGPSGCVTRSPTETRDRRMFARKHSSHPRA